MRNSTLAVLMALLAVFLAVPVYAGGLQWSDTPIYTTLDHIGVSTQLTQLETKGAGYRAVVGPLAKATLGANTFEIGLMSFGVGVVSPSGPETTQTGAQLGFVPGCTERRGMCLEFTAQTVDVAGSKDTDMKYLGTLLFRASQAPGIAPSTPVASRAQIKTFAGLNSID